MAFDFINPNNNPNQPIPNGPFYWPETFTLQAGNGTLIVGTGLQVDAFGRLNATGGEDVGTVTSVGIASTTLTVSGSPITTAGVIDIEVPIATQTIPGIVKAGANIDITLDGTISVPVGSTITPGVIQLNNTVTSVSVSEALTASQGKFLQDQINALSLVANTYLGGTLNTQTGLVLEVTQAGTQRGFVVGSPLPLPNPANAGVFAFVSVASNSYTPPGSVTSYTTYVGDVFVMSNTTWLYLPSGFQPQPATTTQAGIVRLATTTEVNAGTDNTIAVTPFGLADELNLYVEGSTFTAKGDLIAGTGASSYAALGVGSAGQVLSADPTAPTGLRWIANDPDGVLSVTGTSPIVVDNTDPANPVVSINTASFVLDADYTAKGDILAGSAASTPSVLPVGSTGQVLSVDPTTSTGLKWVDNTADGVLSVSGTAPITVNNTDPQNPVIGLDTPAITETSSTFYVNAGYNDIQTVLDALTPPQFAQIYFAAGYIDGTAVQITNQVNINITGPDTATGTYVAGFGSTSPRDVQISGASSTRVRLENIQIKGVTTIDGTLGRHYFKNVSFDQGLSVIGATTNYLVFEGCNFGGPVSFASTFAGNATFNNCSFNGNTLTNSASLALQVILTNTNGLDLATANVTFLGLNANGLTASIIANAGILANLSGASAATGYVPSAALDFATKSYVDSVIDGGVAGANTQIQFNNNGSFGADADFTYSTATKTLTVQNIIGTGNDTLDITAGPTNTGLAVRIFGSDAVGTDNAGPVYLAGGDSLGQGQGGTVGLIGGNALGPSLSSAGWVEIRGGDSTGSGDGGSILLAPGAATGTGQPGTTQINAISLARTVNTYTPSNAQDLVTKAYVDARPDAGITSDTFLMGQGAPASSLGVDGQFYVSTPDYTLYNKIGGTWINTYTPDNTHGLQSLINSLAFEATTVLSLDSLLDFYGNPYAVDSAVSAIFTSATVAITLDADHGALEVALSGLTAPQITTLSAAFFPGANLAGDTATTHWDSAVVTASSPGAGLFNIVSNVFSVADIQTILSVPNTVSTTNANRFSITTPTTLFTAGVETSTDQSNRMLVKSSNNQRWVPGPNVTSFLTAGTGIAVSYDSVSQSWNIVNTEPGQGAPIAASWTSQASYSIPVAYNSWTAINNLTLDPTDSVNSSSVNLNFNSSTGTWTCTEAGLYTFNGFVNWGSFAGPGTSWTDQSLNRITLAFAKNQNFSQLGISDDNYGWNDAFPPLNSDVGQAAAGIVYLQSGDTINLMVRQFNASGAPINIEPAESTQLGPDLSVRVTAQRVNFGANTGGTSPIDITEGTTVPQSTAGNDGDLFLLTTPNPQVLYQKVNGAWVTNEVLSNLATNASLNQNKTLTLGQLADVVYDDNYGVNTALQAAIVASSPTTTLDYSSYQLTIDLASVSGLDRNTINSNVGKGFGLYFNGAHTAGSGDWYVDVYNIDDRITSMTLNCILQSDSFTNFSGLTGFTPGINSATIAGSGPFTGGVYTNELTGGALLMRSADNEGWIQGPNFPTFLQAGTGINVSYNSSTLQWTVSATNSGTVTSVTGTAPITVDNTNPATPIIGVNAASTTAAGVVQLNDTVTSTSTTQALTANQGKLLQDQVDLKVASVTATAPITVGGTATNPVIAANAASVTTSGVVTLTNDLTSTSEVLALTAAAGKSLQDQINALVISGVLELAGTINASTGLVATVTAAGTTAGFTAGSALPAAAAGNANFYVIVTTPGTFTPPGGSATSCINGDWVLSDGTTWLKLAVGPEVSPGGANTTVQYNNNGDFAGDTRFTWNDATGVLTTLNLQALSISGNGTAALVITGATAASGSALDVQISGGSATGTGATGGNLTISPGNGPGGYGQLNLAQISSATVSSSYTVTNNSDLATKAYVDANSRVAAGSNTQVQFNNNGVLGASPSLTFNSANGVLGATTINGNSANLLISSEVAASSVYINSGVGTVSSGAGNINIIAAPGFGTNLSRGGSVTIQSGRGSASGGTPGAGDVNIYSANGGVGQIISGNAGNINIVAGNATDFSSSNGGSITIQAGNKGADTFPPGGTPGNVTIAPGSGGSLNLNQIGTATAKATYIPINSVDLATKGYVDSKIVNPAGSDTQVQFNNGGLFGASSNFTFNSATGFISATGLSGNTSNLVINSSLASSSVTINSGGGTGTNAAGNINIVAANGATNNFGRGGSILIQSGTGRNSGGQPGGGDINIISADGGFGTASGNAGNINITGGSAGAFNFSNGGSIAIQAGNGSSTGNPGNVSIAPGSGGGVSISQISSATAKASYVPTNAVDLVTKGYVDNAARPAGSNTQVQFNNNGAFGSNASFTFDSATTTLRSPTLNANTLSAQAGENITIDPLNIGGSVIINAGYGTSSTAAGNITLSPGNQTGGTAGGNLNLKGGESSAPSGVAGQVNITGGNSIVAANDISGGAVNIEGGEGSGSSVSGDVNIAGGSGRVGTNSSGGSVYIAAGTGAGTGTAGSVNISNISSATVTAAYTPSSAIDLVNKAYVDGGAHTVAGANTQVQFNSSGVFAGSASLTFNSSTALLTTQNLRVVSAASPFLPPSTPGLLGAAVTTTGDIVGVESFDGGTF